MGPRSTPFVRLTIAGAAVAVAMAMSPATVDALSCADPGVHDVDALVAAIDGEIFGEPMFEQYDYAVTATVTDDGRSIGPATFVAGAIGMAAIIAVIGILVRQRPRRPSPSAESSSAPADGLRHG